MASSRSVTDFAVQIKRIGDAVQTSQKKGVFDAAFLMKNAIEGERSKAMKGKDYFSRMNQKKTRSNRFVGIRPETNRLYVRFDVKGTYNPTALVVARGPWGLIERGSPSHVITAGLRSLQFAPGRGSKERRRIASRQRDLDIAWSVRGTFSGATPLGNRRTGFGPVYKVANHPGTKGKYPWQRGVDKSKDRAAQTATAIVRSTVVDLVRNGRNTTVYVRGEVGGYTPMVG
jgi:hypothetical protein